MTRQSSHDAAAATRLVRKLSQRYLLVLALVAGLVVLDEAVIQPALLRVNSFAPAINQAGRQRMLSQRLTKAALALEVTTDERARQARLAELQSTLDQWQKAQAALLQSIANQTPELRAAWAAIQSPFDAMCAAAHEIADANGDRAGDDRSTRAALHDLLLRESEYLPIMERIVALVEDTSERQVGFLRTEALVISASVLMLLMGLGWFVVLPATRTIRGQVDGLEQTVRNRTRELSAANRELEREIAEHGKAEEEKQRLAGQLAHAARMSSLGHLATGLAHEINQPLAAIANFSEAGELLLSRNETSDGRLARHFQELKRAALRAGSIVRRIRNFAKPVDSAATPTSLRSLIREVAELCRFQLERAGVRLSLQLVSDPQPLQLDAIQIQQVLVNLIQNSLQALDDAAIERKCITIATHWLDDVARIEVTDTGPGFGSRDLNAIFAPYFTTKEDGLGVGLSLCRAIVARHGGEIWAQSPPEGGARLCFTLPRTAFSDERTGQPADCVCG